MLTFDGCLCCCHDTSDSDPNRPSPWLLAAHDDANFFNQQLYDSGQAGPAYSPYIFGEVSIAPYYPIINNPQAFDEAAEDHQSGNSGGEGSDGLSTLYDDMLTRHQNNPDKENLFQLNIKLMVYDDDGTEIEPDLEKYPLLEALVTRATDVIKALLSETDNTNFPLTISFEPYQIKSAIRGMANLTEFSEEHGIATAGHVVLNDYLATEAYRDQFDTVVGTLIHEMFHILLSSADLYGPVSEAQDHDFLYEPTNLFTGESATAVFNEIFKLNFNGIPLADGSHLSEAWFGAEMNSKTTTSAYEHKILSLISLKMLEDVGYQVNTEYAELFEIDQTDTDGDGLIDFVENIVGSDINNADSDGDGVSDYIEVSDGYNLVTDWDHDGVVDWLDADVVLSERLKADLKAPLFDTLYSGLADSVALSSYSMNGDDHLRNSKMSIAYGFLVDHDGDVSTDEIFIESEIFDSKNLHTIDKDNLKNLYEFIINEYGVNAGINLGVVILDDLQSADPSVYSAYKNYQGLAYQTVSYMTSPGVLLDEPMTRFTYRLGSMRTGGINPKIELANDPGYWGRLAFKGGNRLSEYVVSWHKDGTLMGILETDAFGLFRFDDQGDSRTYLKAKISSLITESGDELVYETYIAEDRINHINITPDTHFDLNFFNDKNSNGLRDAGESVLSNLLFTLINSRGDEFQFNADALRNYVINSVDENNKILNLYTVRIDDKNGAYELSNPAQVITLLPFAQMESIDVALNPFYEISGEISFENHQGIKPNLKISLFDENNNLLLTEISDASFAFDVQSGTYHLRYEFLDANSPASINGNNFYESTTTVSGQDIGSLDVTISFPTSVISGVTKYDGAPLAGLSLITSLGEEVETNSQGLFYFHDLDQAQIQLSGIRLESYDEGLVGVALNNAMSSVTWGGILTVNENGELRSHFVQANSDQFIDSSFFFNATEVSFTAFIDEDLNGVYDIGEELINNVSVQALINSLEEERLIGADGLVQHTFDTSSLTLLNQYILQLTYDETQYQPIGVPTVSLLPGEMQDVFIPFSKAYDINGSVWADLDNDWLYEAATVQKLGYDMDIALVSLDQFGNEQSVIATKTIDSLLHYDFTFEKVANGDYKIIYNMSPKVHSRAYRFNDNPSETTGVGMPEVSHSQTFSVNDGVVNLDDVVFVSPVKIQGYVFEDIDGNGEFVWDDADGNTKLAGMKVNLYKINDDNGETFLESATTDAQGFYEFNTEAYQTYYRVELEMSPHHAITMVSDYAWLIGNSNKADANGNVIFDIRGDYASHISFGVVPNQEFIVHDDHRILGSNFDLSGNVIEGYYDSNQQLQGGDLAPIGSAITLVDVNAKLQHLNGVELDVSSATIEMNFGELWINSAGYYEYSFTEDSLLSYLSSAEIVTDQIQYNATDGVDTKSALLSFSSAGTGSFSGEIINESAVNKRNHKGDWHR